MFCSRITPAYAGKTGTFASSIATHGDHPRLRGKDHFRAYDIETEEELKNGSTSTNSDARSDHQQPIPLLSSSNLSIRELLKNVNDGLKHGPYVNNDGNPNYGIYFGDIKTGGVIHITPKENTYKQQLNGVKAAYDTNTGAIHLFDAADQSSFIHEAGHMWGSPPLARERRSVYFSMFHFSRITPACAGKTKKYKEASEKY